MQYIYQYISISIYIYSCQNNAADIPKTKNEMIPSYEKTYYDCW